MYKGALATLNKDVYTTLPSKITQQIKDSNKELYGLLDTSITNNSHTKKRFEAYCAQPIKEDELREKELIRYELLKDSKLDERFKSSEAKHEEHKKDTNDKFDMHESSTVHLGAHIMEQVSQINAQIKVKINKW